MKETRFPTLLPYWKDLKSKNLKLLGVESQRLWIVTWASDFTGLGKDLKDYSLIYRAL